MHDAVDRRHRQAGRAGEVGDPPGRPLLVEEAEDAQALGERLDAVLRLVGLAAGRRCRPVPSLAAAAGSLRGHRDLPRTRSTRAGGWRQPRGGGRGSLDSPRASPTCSGKATFVMRERRGRMLHELTGWASRADPRSSSGPVGSAARPPSVLPPRVPAWSSSTATRRTSKLVARAAKEAGGEVATLVADVSSRRARAARSSRRRSRLVGTPAGLPARRRVATTAAPSSTSATTTGSRS